VLTELLDYELPAILTGSPPCNAFSQIRSLGRRIRGPVKEAEDMKRGRATLNGAARAYRRQYDAGRYFLHEAPKGATSWKEDGIMELEQLPGVERVNGPMCAWHMAPPDGIRHFVHPGGPVAKGLTTTPVFCKKETGWLTDCLALAMTLEKVCTNVLGNAVWHRHFHLAGGGIDFSARYPPR